jgi:hypothetical protein
MFVAAEIEPQYAVKHPPRLQPGNAPLSGTAAFDGRDQVDILWQTVWTGDGLQDSFRVEYREALNGLWKNAELNPIIDTEIDTRLIHSATIRGLNWDTWYEYRVQHLRGEAVVATYEQRFRTRLPPGSPRAFTFAAYGDSAYWAVIQNFRAVQSRINQVDPRFVVLLGDNFYIRGEHVDADARFDPLVNPEAVQWNSGHIDYLAVGNHEHFSFEDARVTRELFSVPVPVAGVNSPVQPPSSEYPEHNFSWDFGDVHFVTIDVNFAEFDHSEATLARLGSVIDYAAADLQASPAHWKVVYLHQPIIGTEKNRTPDEFYFQKAVSSLTAAGADLFLAGHSHTYSWTYPMTGVTDRNGDEWIDFSEIDFVPDTDRAYEKGAGLVQTVSGVGGASLRFEDYEQSVFASAYSLTEGKGPLEFGFAKIDVSPRELVVSYISAQSGNIVGDTNANGLADPDEPFFGQFRIIDSAYPSGDLTGDQIVSAADINRLAAALRAGDTDPQFDLDRNQQVDAEDHSKLIADYLGSMPGDADLNRVFTTNDLVTVFVAGQFEDEIEDNSGWSDGDWNADGDFDTQDLVLAFQSGTYF